VTDIVSDSLKDVAVDLIKDNVGGRVSFQIGETIARGIEVCMLHHQREAQQGTAKPKALADVYGSRWLTAGMGSVLMLWGEPGGSSSSSANSSSPARKRTADRVMLLVAAQSDRPRKSR